MYCQATRPERAPRVVVRAAVQAVLEDHVVAGLEARLLELADNMSLRLAGSRDLDGIELGFPEVFDSGWGIDSNTTSIALQALAAEDVAADSAQMVLALDYDQWNGPDEFMGIGPPWVTAGDWLTGSTIEGAIRTGINAAEAILAQ